MWQENPGATKMKHSSSEIKGFWAAYALLLLYVSPLFILGQNAHIRVHDNMDSNMAWYRVLVRSGEWFGSTSAVIPQIMNGTLRSAFGTEFSGIVLLHALFPSMVAYAISQTITRTAAFAGMYMLLKRHLVKEPDAAIIRIGASLAFALTPFWPSGMLSTLGQPLALWAFLNIREGKGTWREWLVLSLLPFYSSLVLGFFFFLMAAFGLWLWDVIVKKQKNLPFLGSILGMGLLYIGIEYRLLLSLVFTDDATSRNEFVSSRLNFEQCMSLFAKNFIYGHNHVKTLHTWILLPVMGLALYLSLRRQSWKHNPAARLFLLLFGLSTALSLWYAFWFHLGWQPLKDRFSLLQTFNFARFHFLRPLLLYVSFALACLLLWQDQSRSFVKGILIGQIVLLFLFNEEIVYRHLNSPSFRQFYAVEQFREIDHYIGLPKDTYRLISIGLHPAIAQYNGFYTLDSYNNFYSLTYKHQFREIIASELDKNQKLRTYFDTWGGRCYIFVAELGKKFDFRKTSKQQICDLQLNMKSFTSLGGRFVLSSLPIRHPAANHLILRQIFLHADSAWKVYLYEIE
jgi:hypothetical protein